MDLQRMVYGFTGRSLDTHPIITGKNATFRARDMDLLPTSHRLRHHIDIAKRIATE